MKHLKQPQQQNRGLTLMELLLSIALMAIFGVFLMEFLTSSWLATEKDFSRIKCVTTANNILEMAGGMAIANSNNPPSGDDLETTYKRILGNDFSPTPPNIDVSTWTLIAKDSPLHPDRIGYFYAQIATYPGYNGSYTLFVGDALLANVIEIKTSYSSQPVAIDYGITP